MTKSNSLGVRDSSDKLRQPSSLNMDMVESGYVLDGEKRVFAGPKKVVRRFVLCSRLSCLAILSVLSFMACASFMSAFSLLSFMSIGSATSALSVGSVNSALSIASINSVLSIGCIGESMKICFSM